MKAAESTMLVHHWVAEQIDRPSAQLIKTVIRLAKMDVQEVGGGRGGWVELAQDRDRWRVLVSPVKNLRVP
jgi:hypothetical protein